MQLFVTEYKKKDSTIVIADTDLLSQLRKVLRASIGDIIWIQSPENEGNTTRYEVRIEVRDTTTLEGTIISEKKHECPQQKKSIIIAMPNKWDKVELIVQKLTECGLDQIIFWPSERSVIKEWKPKKAERLQKIIKEAVEQSRGWSIPKLMFISNIGEYLQDKKVIVFDKQETGTQTIKKPTLVKSSSSLVTGIIGPEGGLTYRDYQIFEGTDYDIYGLGETVLRTETAAIIGGRILKNN